MCKGNSPKGAGSHPSLPPALKGKLFGHSFKVRGSDLGSGIRGLNLCALTNCLFLFADPAFLSVQTLSRRRRGSSSICAHLTAGSRSLARSGCLLSSYGEWGLSCGSGTPTQVARGRTQRTDAFAGAEDKAGGEAGSRGEVRHSSHGIAELGDRGCADLEMGPLLDENLLSGPTVRHRSLS